MKNRASREVLRLALLVRLNICKEGIFSVDHEKFRYLILGKHCTESFRILRSGILHYIFGLWILIPGTPEGVNPKTRL